MARVPLLARFTNWVPTAIPTADPANQQEPLRGVNWDGKNSRPHHRNAEVWSHTIPDCPGAEGTGERVESARGEGPGCRRPCGGCVVPEAGSTKPEPRLQSPAEIPIRRPRRLTRLAPSERERVVGRSLLATSTVTNTVPRAWREKLERGPPAPRGKREKWNGLAQTRRPNAEFGCGPLPPLPGSPTTAGGGDAGGGRQSASARWVTPTPTAARQAHVPSEVKRRQRDLPVSPEKPRDGGGGGEDGDWRYLCRSNAPTRIMPLPGT